MPVSDDDLRKIIRENQPRIKSLMITGGQNSVVDACDIDGGLSACDLSEMDRCSIQSASTGLRRLHDLGYLRREEFSQSSGGSEYRYYAA